MQSSGYKLNYTKSEILPLNIQDSNIRTLTDPLKWCNNGFKYLDIQIEKSDWHIFKYNYSNNKLLEQTKLDIQRWKDRPLSLIGRTNTIKMNILPKFIYLFQCLPITIAKSFFKETDKMITPFCGKRRTLGLNSALCKPHIQGEGLTCQILGIIISPLSSDQFGFGCMQRKVRPGGSQ